jgi:hypothetical protein
VGKPRLHAIVVQSWQIHLFDPLDEDAGLDEPLVDEG